MKKQRKRSLHYLQEFTGYFGLSFNYWIIYNSNISTQVNADRLLLSEFHEIPPQLQKSNKHLSFFDPRLVPLKSLKSYEKNEKKAMSIIRNIKTKTRDF